MIRRIAQYAGQAVVYALIALVLGYLADSPAYQHFAPDKALLKLSFAHGAEPKGACRTLSAEELADKAENMRRAKVCPRERLPVTVELRVDGKTVYAASLPPTGLAGDGPSLVYRRFPVDPGEHRLFLGLRDTDRASGFDYVREAVVTLEPRQSLAIGFRADGPGFVLY